MDTPLLTDSFSKGIPLHFKLLVGEDCNRISWVVSHEKGITFISSSYVDRGPISLVSFIDWLGSKWRQVMYFVSFLLPIGWAFWRPVYTSYKLWDAVLVFPFFNIYTLLLIKKKKTVIFFWPRLKVGITWNVDCCHWVKNQKDYQLLLVVCLASYSYFTMEDVHMDFVLGLSWSWICKYWSLIVHVDTCLKWVHPLVKNSQMLHLWW